MQQEYFLRDQKSKMSNKMSEDGESRLQTRNASEGSMDKRKLMQPRSKMYIRAMMTADDETETEEVIEKVVKKMPVNNKLVGILAGCKIPGCIIHAIDKAGNILEHYQTESDIPEALQQGYQVFLQHKGCFSVEVYTLYYCVVYEDGSTKFYERNVTD